MVLLNTSNNLLKYSTCLIILVIVFFFLFLTWILFSIYMQDIFIDHCNVSFSVASGRFQIRVN